MKYQSNRYSGFTLIEIVLVMFILGVALSITAVYFTKTYEKTLLKEDVRRVHNLLRLARNTALFERTVVIFSVAKDGTSVQIEKVGLSSGEVRKMSRGTKVEGDRIIFYPKGDSSGGSILIKAGRSEYEIEVAELTGNARVKRKER